MRIPNVTVLELPQYLLSNVHGENINELLVSNKYPHEIFEKQISALDDAKLNRSQIIVK